MATFASSHRKWNLISDYEEITTEVVALNERIYDDSGITKEGLNELEGFLQRIEVKVDKIEKEANVILWKLLALLSFFLAVLGEAINWIPKPEYVTKHEVESLIKKQFLLYERKLREGKQFRITNRECKVMLKPQIKSLVVEKLPIDLEVVILQVHRKWIYASYSSPQDNLPQTGWIMKKYL